MLRYKDTTLMLIHVLACMGNGVVTVQINLHLLN